jgi:hypothetical protein
VKETYPVVIFSHGGRCSRDRYTDFAEHWASHGYIVIQPAHMDSSSLPPPKIRGMEMMNESVRTRRLDMRFILDSFDEIQKLVPGIDGRLDAENVAASGHSLGGGTAMAVTGLVMEDRRGGAPFGMKDDRFDALLLITNPGNSPMMPDDPWRAISLPTFVATGTNDFSGLVRHIKKSESIFRFSDGVVLSETPNHYLFIDNMNHYLGGLICKELEDDEPDHKGWSALHVQVQNQHRGLDAGRGVGSRRRTDRSVDSRHIPLGHLNIHQIPPCRALSRREHDFALVESEHCENRLQTLAIEGIPLEFQQGPRLGRDRLDERVRSVRSHTEDDALGIVDLGSIGQHQLRKPVRRQFVELIGTVKELFVDFLDLGIESLSRVLPDKGHHAGETEGLRFVVNFVDGEQVKRELHGHGTLAIRQVEQVRLIDAGRQCARILLVARQRKDRRGAEHCRDERSRDH